eukprot:scaffold81178_cov47-Prasinocladus_malaysianus.AAC.1
MPLDLLLVANDKGKAEYCNPMQLQTALSLPCLRDARRGPDTHVELFPDGGPHMEQLGHAYEHRPPQPRLTSRLAPHKPHKDKPPHVVELCAGIATSLEALLRNGHTI